MSHLDKGYTKLTHSILAAPIRTVPLFVAATIWLNEGMSEMVVVELFGIARQRAGVAELTLPRATLRDMIHLLEQQCPGLGSLLQDDGTLTASYLLSINGVAFRRDLNTELPPGCRLLLLSADMGG